MREARRALKLLRGVPRAYRVRHPLEAPTRRVGLKARRAQGMSRELCVARWRPRPTAEWELR